MSLDGPSERAAELARLVQETLGIIASVHSLKGVPDISVRFTHSARRGAYVPEQYDHEHDPEKRRRIELSTLGDTLAFSFAHEFAHYLDDAIGKFEVYSSMDMDGPMHQVRVALEASQAIRALRAIERGEQTASRPEYIEATRLLNETEQWARAYSQYIAQRSGNERLLGDIDVRMSDVESPLAGLCQWADDDFMAIAASIDVMLQELGLSR